MTYVGIVGNGFDKFTPDTALKAKALIDTLLAPTSTTLVSGRSPVGGIDVWAEEAADQLCRSKVIHEPRIEQWNPPNGYGYRARNLDIARDSDVLHVCVVRKYPPGYVGQRFTQCYHCLSMGRDAHHVKSGACWTAKQALAMNKEVVWHVI